MATVPAPTFKKVPTPAGRPAASVYAASMLDTAGVSNAASVNLHGRGPAASTENIVPVPVTISAHVTPIAAPLAGLVPIFPVITDGGTSVIPVFVRITKFPAVPRSTGAGPSAGVVTVRVAAPEMPPDVAVMVAVPADTPVATPGDTTVATATAPEVHVTVLLMSELMPSEAVPVATNRCVPPIATEAVAGATVIDVGSPAPLPHPVAKATSSDATNHVRNLQWLSKLLISFIFVRLLPDPEKHRCNRPSPCRCAL